MSSQQSPSPSSGALVCAGSLSQIRAAANKEEGQSGPFGLSCYFKVIFRKALSKKDVSLHCLFPLKTLLNLLEVYSTQLLLALISEETSKTSL